MNHNTWWRSEAVGGMPAVRSGPAPAAGSDVARFGATLAGSTACDGAMDGAGLASARSAEPPCEAADAAPSKPGRDAEAQGRGTTRDGGTGAPNGAGRRRSSQDERGNHRDGQHGGEQAAAVPVAGPFGLFAAPLAPAAAPVAPEAPLPPSAAATVAVVAAVAERLLVAANGAQEVHITVRPDVLPGVDIRLTREDGRWIVDFNVSDAASLAVLQSAGDGIATTLARRLRSGVEVKLQALAGTRIAPRREREPR
ncbi:type III secretion HpaP family protein [Rugamonas aquatica]|uniref:Flagellar hook-length control protein FliK n=1 Tax=Rugamonas aquatica TaxID=2743357 RepID=A0A6A7N6H0_9BURK|nr:hypothetical protein [Rugamonas aquatica]MQA40725.1 hypothetical protein [Rugamonas aquatica]